MKKRMLRAHYAIWAIMAITLMVAGMLYRGQQDIIELKAREQGMIDILKEMNLAQLSDLKI